MYFLRFSPSALLSKTISILKYSFFGVLFIGTTNAGSFSVETGVAYATVSGIRPYATAKQALSKNDTSYLTVPFFRCVYLTDSDLSFGLAYAYYDRLESSGRTLRPLTPNESLIEPWLVPQRGVQLQSSEKIHEMSVDCRYAWRFSNRISGELGPVLSWFHSLAEIRNTGEYLAAPLKLDPITGQLENATYYGYKLGKFKADDFRLGATAAVRFALAKAWSLTASYRYAAPPERKLHLYGLALGYRF